MALVICRLKLRLYRRSFERSMGKASFVGSLLFAAALAGRLVAAFVEPPANLAHGGGPYLVTLFSLAAGVWIALAILTLTSGEMLPPGLLTAYPLSRRSRTIGLFAASFIGVAPLATLIAFLSALVGFANSPLAAVVIVLAALLGTAFCLALSVIVSTSLGLLMHSRRGRDIGAIVGGCVGGLGYLIYKEVQDILDSAAPSRGGTVVDVLTATPAGALGRAIAEARSGSVALAGALLLASAVVVIGMLALWSGVVERLSVEASGLGGAVSKRRDDRLSLPISLFRHFPDQRAAVGCAAELRSIQRDPRRLMQYIGGLVIAALVVGLWQYKAGGIDPTFAGWAGVFLLQTTAPAQFAFDADATWAYVVAAGNPRSDLLGKNLALLIIAMVVLTPIACVLALTSGRADLLAGAVIAALGSSMAWIGMGSIASLVTPVGIPRDPNKVPKPSAGLRLLGFMGICMALALPPPALAYLSERAGATNVPGAALGLVYGAAVWWLGFRSAGMRLERRHPEIAAALITA